jgi:hypothetical protein
MSFFADAVSDSVTDDFTNESKPATFSNKNHTGLDSFDRETLSAAGAAKMPGFADSFWSSDYAGGLGILFQKLQQGITENQQMLTIASMRADAEEMYSERLGDIAPTIDRMTGGFTRDDGASVRKVMTPSTISSGSTYSTARHTRAFEAKWSRRQKITRKLRRIYANWLSILSLGGATRMRNEYKTLKMTCSPR